MARYREKDSEFEAEQFFSDKRPWPTGVCGDECERLYCPAGPHIHALWGAIKVSDGDWIKAGALNSHYSIKPDIFKRDYEPVEPEQTQ